MVVAYISLGSNLGDRQRLMDQAVGAIAKLPETQLKQVSRVQETEPLGVTDQPNFLNAVAEIETKLPAEELLVQLQQIELQLGRVRERHWGPRTMDLDILYYGEAVIQTDRLRVPHPEIQNRSFIIDALKELKFREDESHSSPSF